MSAWTRSLSSSVLSTSTRKITSSMGEPSKSVQRCVLVAQVADQRRVLQRPAGRPPAQLAGPPAHARPVALLVQPGLEPGELALAEVVVEPAEVAPGRVHQL